MKVGSVTASNGDETPETELHCHRVTGAHEHFISVTGTTYNVCTATGHQGEPGICRLHSWGADMASISFMRLCPAEQKQPSLVLFAE